MPSKIAPINTIRHGVQHFAVGSFVNGQKVVEIKPQTGRRGGFLVIGATYVKDKETGEETENRMILARLPANAKYHRAYPPESVSSMEEMQEINRQLEAKIKDLEKPKPKSKSSGSTARKGSSKKPSSSS